LRQIAAHMAGALALLALGPGCSSVPPRVQFNPTSGPPECMGLVKRGEYATAEWGKFNADVARLAKAMEFDESNSTIVRQHLDLAVRALVDRQGCVVGGAFGPPGGYTLSCGAGLSPDVERERTKLLGILNEELPAATQSAKSYGDKCGVSFLSLAWTSGMPIGGSATLGCNSIAPVEVCQHGCDNGNADACEVVGRNSKDPAAKTEAKARECEVRLQTKGDAKMAAACAAAITTQLGLLDGTGTPMGVGGTKERAQKLLSAACAADPAGSTCTTFSGKIDILSMPLRPRLAPGAGFYCAGAPTWLSCSRDDCVQTAAANKAIPGFACVQRASAHCFSYAIAATPGTSCSGNMTECQTLLAGFAKNASFQITSGCSETR
jgi:hypothetical protein